MHDGCDSERGRCWHPAVPDISGCFRTFPFIEQVFVYRGGMTPPRAPDGDVPAPALEHLDRLLTAAPNDCTDTEVAAAVVELASLADTVECALVRWADALDGRTIWTGDASKTPGSWIAARTELGRAAAGAKVHLARDLRACPVVEASYRAGHIGTAKVRAAMHARKACPDTFTEHEAVIVAEIEPLTVDEAIVVLRRWATLANQLRTSRTPDPASDRNGDGGDDGDTGSDATATNPLAENRLHLSTTFGGSVVGDLALDPVNGAELSDAVNARVDHLFETGVFHADDGLTMAARRAWALCDLVGDGVRPSTRQGKPRPSVSLVLDQRTAAGQPIDDLHDLLSRRCELANGTPVTRSVAERLLCSCTLTTLVERTLADGQTEIAGVTDTVRDATWRQRAVLAHRDGGCAFPGCDTPPERCQAHHLHPYEHGGPTLVDNLVLLCRYHHHTVHEGGWHLARGGDGALHLAKPDGTGVPMIPQGHKVRPLRPPDPPPRT
jgi:hypothetical protein